MGWEGDKGVTPATQLDWGTESGWAHPGAFALHLCVMMSGKGPPSLVTSTMLVLET